MKFRTLLSFLCLFCSLFCLVESQAQSQVIQRTVGSDCVNSPQAFAATCMGNCSGYSWTISGSYAPSTNLNGSSIGGFSWTSPGSYSVSVSFTQDGNQISDTYSVTINDSTVPEVTISVSPAGSTVYGTPLTFSVGTSVGGGSTPTYQWFLNGQPESGATGSQYQRNDLQNEDEIHLTMASSDVCASPSADDSNIIPVAVTYLLTVPEVDDVTTPYNTSAKLTAVGAGAGETYRWYTAPTGGIYFEDSSFTTPPLTARVTYYVAKRNTNGDESARVPQTVTLTVGVPDMPTMSLNTCGPKEFTRGTPPNGVSWWWVGTNPNGTTGSSGPTYIVDNANNETHYLRAFVDDTWSEAIGFKVTTDPVDLVLYQYDVPEVQATNSITLAPGFTVPAGKTFTARIGITSECNDILNWSEQITYDQNGEINARSKIYADGFGEAIQNQSIDLVSNMVWVSQPVYDFQNQPAITTLPAPIREKDFIYKKNFVTSAVTSQAYAPSDFDNSDGASLEKVVNPNAVGTAPGTVGWYYSSNNNLEPATPVTNFPYSRSYTPPGPDPLETTSAAPGDNYKMGSGHEVKVEKKTFLKSELANYFAIRPHFVATTLPVSHEGTVLLSQDGTSTAGYTQVGNVSPSLLTQNNETYVKILSNESQGNPGVKPLNSSIAASPGEVYVFRVKGYRDASGLVALRIKDGSNNSDIVWPGAALPGGAVNEEWIENTFIVPDGCTSIELSILWSAFPASGDAFYINALSLTRVTNSESMVYGYKMITKDPDGKKSVTFTDADGRVLASAVITSESGTNPTTYVYDNWSYTYYNEAGQVVASVAPNGVTGGASLPSFVTYTKYDQLGRVIETSSPDEGMSQFVYNLDGQIRFSQNEVQRNFTDPVTQTLTPKFSYTNYDYLGRLIESGEYISKGTDPFIFEPHTIQSAAPNSVLNITENKGFTGVTRDRANPDTRYTDFTYIEYDVIGSGFSSGNEPTNFFGQVSKTENAISKTWYSYDEFGQLIWTNQHINGLGDKIIEYTYDYYGNVTQVAYQKGTTAPNEASEEFYHHYIYDNNQRLSEVHTSRDGINKTLQAKYFYYLHGPLKRVELAGNLQGVDYVYNIDGSLKMINHADPALDPGKDGLTGEHSNFMADVFGEVLDYSTSDYTGAGYNDGTLTLNTHPDQFGGGVKAIRWHSPTDMHVPRAYAFTYDNLNQMENANWGNVSGTDGTYGFSPNGSQAYKENIAGYDKNGNITSLGRKGKTGNTLADYDYNYFPNSNKLESITNENIPFLSYEYNAVGQMIKQTEGSKSMEVSYNAYGLVKEVKNIEGTNLLQRIIYDYDDRGDRVRKTVLNASDEVLHQTYNVSDASGNTVATYEKIGLGGTVTLAELPVYGAGRIAIYKPQVHTTFYEISDHLGNVRGVIGNPETLVYVATLEDNDQAAITNPRVQEIAYFKNLWDVEEDEHPFANHTLPSQHVPAPTYTAYMNWIDGQSENGPETKSVGPAIGLKVEPGDVIDMETYVKYEKKQEGYSRSSLGAVMASILGNNFVGTAAGIDVITKATQVFQDGLTPLLGTVIGNGNEGNTLPHAYLYYILFDRNFDLITAGWDRVPFNGEGGFDPQNEAFSTHGKLTIPTVTITEPGYIYVFVANESENTKVWFDDVKVTHQRSTIVAGADYYPFGLVMEDRKITREDYRYGYQGQFSEEDKETGWNEFELRMYNARIGRWMSPDPYGQYASPYIAMGNNPVLMVDPDGGFSCPKCGTALAQFGDLADQFAVMASRLPSVASIGTAILVDGVKTWTRNGLMIEPQSDPYGPTEAQLRRWNSPTVDTSLPAPNTANLSSIGISPPNFAESLIPIWGSGREAASAFSAGNYWKGAAYTALAISDIFLVKSIASGLARGAWKLGSHTWGATRSWYGRRYDLAKGTQVHHWAISQQTIKKYGLQSWANQPWNLKPIPTLGPFSSQTVHLAVHGRSTQVHFNFARRFWYGTPEWFKAGSVSSAGRIPGAFE